MKRTLFTVYKERYRYLYTAALAICGNETDAGEILASAVIEAGMKASFDKALRIVIERASEFADADAQVEFLSDSALSEETPEVRRAAMLRFGLGMSSRKAADISGLNKSEAARLFKRFSAIPDISRICREELKKGEYAPDAATFRQMLNGVRVQDSEKHVRHSGLGRTLSGILLMLLIGIMIWMSVVMLDYYAKVFNETRTEVTDVNG